VGKLRILVIEDDVLVSELLGELLSALGHDVCATAKTEAGAVAAAAQHGPDLILVDISLKEGDGISAMKTITRTSSTPHVFMTGDRRRDLPKHTIMLQKPFHEPDLVRALARALAQPGEAFSSSV
jgi:CheY-like chemotaxis protein